jgi:hypothetical protein
LIIRAHVDALVLDVVANLMDGKLFIILLWSTGLCILEKGAGCCRHVFTNDDE